MSLTNYSDLTASVATWLQRTDLTATIPDFITLFESFANRKLRVRQQEASVTPSPMTGTVLTAGTNINVETNGEVGIEIGDGSALATAGFSSGDIVTVAGIVGTTEANGTFSINVVPNANGSSLSVIVLLGSKFVNAYVSGGTVTNLSRFAVPSDYLSWRRLTWLGNPRRELEYVEPSWLQSAFPVNNSTGDLPGEFTIEGGSIVVRPGNASALQLLYWQKIPSLAANSTNWLMTAHPDVYLFGTLVEAQAYAVNADTAALWKSRRDELIEEIITLSNRTRGPGAIRTMSPTP